MNPTTPSAAEDLSKLSDRDLIERFCKDRSNQDIATALWERHSPTILSALKKQAYLSPAGCDRRSFVDSSFSRAYINFFRRICGFKFEGSIDGWLYKLAGTAELDERRKITGKRAESEEETDEAQVPEEEVDELKAGEEPQKHVRWEDLEPLIDDCGFRSGVPRLETKNIRDAQTILSETRARPVPQPDQIFLAKERKYLVRELLIRHAEESDRDAESSYTIRLRYWRDWSVSKIAEYFYGELATDREKTKRERAVYRSLDSDFRKLQISLAEEFGISSFSQT